MPPEQAAGEKEITTAADIYSLGAILYEALTGEPPHRGESPMQTLKKAMEESPVPPAERGCKVDGTLELICMKCLERSPDDRYASAAAFADDLEAWLADEPVSVRPPTLASAFTSAVQANLRSALGAALIGLVLGGAVAWFAIVGMAIGGFGGIGDVFQRFPSESQPVFWLKVRELAQSVPLPRLLGSIAIFVCLFFVGMLNVWLVRPKTRGESLAIATVCGLVMTTLMYVPLGFLMINVYSSHRTSSEIFRLANIAFWR